MCGIAGIFRLADKQAIDQKLLKTMSDAQSHRGPDDDGFYFDDGVGLAHRRLSIIDLAGGHQPMLSADKTVSIVFNGEIYNYQELFDTLKAKGYNFQTRSDTESIIYAWQEWGVDCVDHLRGMFAFSIYDSSKDCMFIARDRLGIKPLFYANLLNGDFVFGSELKVLQAHPEIFTEFDDRAVEDYFTLGYVPEPKSIYKNVFKLEPGHTLLLNRNDSNIEPKQYWDIPMQSPEYHQGDVKEELVKRMKEAVDIRLESEVPLGAFLSGGVDSSAVVAMMSQIQEEPVNTCAIGFDVKAFNETEFAQMVVDRYQTNHYEQTVSADDFDLIDKLGEIYDEPYADSSAIPTYRVCKMAREKVTVALSGDGGDELFAGYSRYRWHMREQAIRDKLPLALRKPIFGTLGKLYPKLDWAPRIFRGKTTFQSMSYDWVEGYMNTMSILRTDERSKLYSKEFKERLNGYSSLEVFKKHAEKAPSDSALSQAQYIDIKTYLVGDILTKVDRASMAHSLEVRVPLIDHKFMEWAVNIPPEQRLVGSSGKDIFKKALEPHLPDDVLYRKKMGFAVPLAKWFRGPLKEKLKRQVLSQQMFDCGYFNPKQLNTLVDQHLKGVRDNSASLWTLLMFSSFLNVHQQRKTQKDVG